jgi:hypothetical protein
VRAEGQAIEKSDQGLIGTQLIESGKKEFAMTSGELGQKTGPALVHKPMYRAWFSIITWTATLVASVTFCFVLGCGGKSEAPAGATSEQASTNVQYADLADKLVGVWLGEAYLDEDRFAERLENLTQPQVDDLVRKAQYFVGTVMAIDFKPNGTLENQIEIAPPGVDPISQQGEGTWRIIEVREDGVVVEIAELNPDGSKTMSRKAYRFYDDGEHFAVSIPLEDVLGECNPMIVFERQHLDEPQGTIAAAPGDTQTK